MGAEIAFGWVFLDLLRITDDYYYTASFPNVRPRSSIFLLLDLD